jgi:hypothetical protein
MFLQTVGQRDYVFHCLGAHRNNCVATTHRLVKIADFKHSYDHFTFGKTTWSDRGKVLSRSITVVIAIDVVTVAIKEPEQL